MDSGNAFPPGFFLPACITPRSCRTANLITPSLRVGFLFGIICWIPVFFLFLQIVKIYRKRIAPKLSESKIVKSLKKSSFGIQNHQSGSESLDLRLIEGITRMKKEKKEKKIPKLFTKKYSEKKLKKKILKRIHIPKDRGNGTGTVRFPP